MLPAEIYQAVLQSVTPQTATGEALPVIRPIAGGDINRAFIIKTGKSAYFLKFNDAKRYPSMFKAEAEGLRLLSKNGTPRIPEVIATGENDCHSWLLLEFIEKGSPGSHFWESFGQQLACLHRHSHHAFGLDHANYIGSLPQSNTYHQSWCSFFVEERIQPQLRMASNSRFIDKSLNGHFERMFLRLPEIFPTEPPALLHGDLWSGNFLCDNQGNPCLIDPAVYFGFREMDLAMTRLFGGFSPEFYREYQAVFPLEPGWEMRFDICNLYPLLVHVNLFGGGYVQSVKQVVSRF